MDSEKLNSIILFTSERKIKNLSSRFLTLLEARIIYIKSLEQILIKMGVGDYENSPIDYQKDRKIILDEAGTYIRELQEIKKLIS